MFYFQIIDGEVRDAKDEISPEERESRLWFCRAGVWAPINTDQIAESATRNLGRTFLSVDHGEHVHPRYEVIEAPAVGDPVSYGFNGDYYPDGEIVKISKNHKIITTSTGSRYYRRKQTGRWVKQGGTWSLVRCHRSELNPEF